MRRTASLVVISAATGAACLVATACSSGAAPSGGGAGGSSSFTVTSSMPASSGASVSYALSVSFTTAGPACASTTVGPCTVNPCYSASSSGDGEVVLPNAGLVTLLSGNASLGLEPQSDGTYASESVVGVVPWETAGDIVAFEWAHFPGDTGEPGDAVTLPAPPYVTLAEGSAFAALAGSVARDTDLTVAWTSTSPAAPTDDVVVDFVSGGTQVYCTFNAGAGSGVVPADALEQLEQGVGRYSITSKTHASESIAQRGEAPWTLSFNVQAVARTSYGLAQGPLTLE